jgi:hypothetical protein
MASEPAGRGPGSPAAERRRSARGWYWLLALPLLGTLIPPIYNADGPRLIGIPFFYWYQMLWILISAILTIVVYRATRGAR